MEEKRRRPRWKGKGGVLLTISTREGGRAGKLGGKQEPTGEEIVGGEKEELHLRSPKASIRSRGEGKKGYSRNIFLKEKTEKKRDRKHASQRGRGREGIRLFRFMD